MMGRCKLTSICGCDRCCIECPENEVCKEQCARMDRYEYCVEGQYVYITNPLTEDGKPIKHLICNGTNIFNDLIDPDTLCQYTGLTDKNGKKIWENDICEMVYDGVVHIYIIVWDKEELDFKGTNGKENYGINFEYLGCCEEIVVIGNIFDNPELLEVE